MSESDGEQAVVINVGSCRCSGASHPDGDTVTLRPVPNLAMGLAAEAAIGLNQGEPTDLAVALGRVWLRYGITAWTFTEHGLPVPVASPLAYVVIERWLPWDAGGFTLADRADDLYWRAVVAPLVEKSKASRQLSLKNGSTSPSVLSGQNTPRSPRRSSRSQAVAGT